MQKLKAFKILFLLAAILFVAKPFIGFGAFQNGGRSLTSSSILVKSFTKRKPESLLDANAKAEAMHNSLTHPSLLLYSAITILLTTLFPLLLKSASQLTVRILEVFNLGSLPSEPVYLVTGKLLI